MPVAVRVIPALLLLSCSGALPAHLADPRVHPRYPPARFITAVGRSSRSGAEAEADARRVIVERIRAEVVSLFEAMEREQREEDRVTSRASYLVVLRTEARFAHAELIRIDQSLAVRHDGEEYAFAYADIAELARVLGHEYEREATAFRSAVRAALAAPDLPAFAGSNQEARRSYARLSSTAFELYAICRTEHGPFASDTRLYSELVDQRRARLSATRVHVRAEVADALVEAARVEGLITLALASLGVTATTGACGTGLSLDVVATPVCGRGSFGHHCTISLTAALGPCGTGHFSPKADLSDPSFKGASPKGEPEARVLMWAKVTAEVLADRLREGFAAALPFE